MKEAELYQGDTKIEEQSIEKAIEAGKMEKVKVTFHMPDTIEPQTEYTVKCVADGEGNAENNYIYRDI